MSVFQILFVKHVYPKRIRKKIQPTQGARARPPVLIATAAAANPRGAYKRIGFSKKLSKSSFGLVLDQFELWMGFLHKKLYIVNGSDLFLKLKKLEICLLFIHVSRRLLSPHLRPDLNSA